MAHQFLVTTIATLLPNAPVPLCRIYSRMRTNWQFEFVWVIIPGQSSNDKDNDNQVLLICVVLAGRVPRANNFHSCLKRVVIIFVAQLTCCILVILTVYFIIHACNISDEWSANMTRKRRREPSRLLTIFMLNAKALRMIRTVIHTHNHTHTYSYLLDTYFFVLISWKHHTLYDRVDSNWVPPVCTSV